MISDVILDVAIVLPTTADVMIIGDLGQFAIYRVTIACDAKQSVF
jgi:hypothetical protein